MIGCFNTYVLSTYNQRFRVYPCKTVTTIEVWDTNENTNGWTNRLSYELSQYVTHDGYYVQVITAFNPKLIYQLLTQNEPLLISEREIVRTLNLAQW